MCKQCNLKPVYEFTNQRKLCKNCFINYFQKKALYIIRKFKMLKSDDIVAYQNNGDFRNVVLQNVLKIVAEKGTIQLVKLPSKRKFTKKAVAFTIDLQADKIVHTLIKKNVNNFKDIAPIDKKIIKPFYLFLNKEVLLYAKLKKLRFKKEKVEKDKISLFIEYLETKHPEVKRAVVNSYLELYYS